MAVYRYYGRNDEGQSVKGLYKADSKSAVATFLKSRGIYPVTIKEEDTGDLVKTLRELTKKAKSRDLAVYCRQFSAIINAGIPIVKALEILQRQAISPILAKATKNIKEDIVGGLPLGHAFRNNSDVFPEIFINMIEAGEISGSLNKALERLANHFDREHELTSKVKSATTYPIILSVTAIMVVIFVVTSVLPVFANLFESYGATLPIPTRALLKMAGFFGKYYIFLVFSIVLILMLFFKVKSTPKGRWKIERGYFKIPILGPTAVKLELSRFARTLSTMISNGIPLLDAVETMNRVIGSEILKAEAYKIRESIQRGAGISEAARAGSFFPPLFVEMTAVGEETGQLDVMLDKIADYYDEEVKDVFNRLSTILEPVIMVVMAIIIGFIVIAIVLPMFEMLQFVG